MSVTVKIKGRDVFADGVKVASIRGWRNPAGRDHVPYMISCVNGKQFENFAYAKDAQKYARLHIDQLM